MLKFNTIYTIGYGNESVDDFISRLQKYKIQYVVDVRSFPYSKYNTAFSKTELQQELRQYGIGYLFMGDQLGGRPKDDSCYTNNKVDYEKLSRIAPYQAGIARLHVALEKQYQVALMCSELKPENCHRSKLIGESLERDGIVVSHIDKDGSLVTQKEVILRLTNGQLTLFDMNYTSKKAYR